MVSDACSHLWLFIFHLRKSFVILPRTCNDGRLATAKTSNADYMRLVSSYDALVPESVTTHETLPLSAARGHSISVRGPSVA